MDLINRYLQAVKFWLPKNQKQDIVAELAEDLRSQIEDREAELGRQLNESEVAELLKQRGRPVLVANRYRPPALDRPGVVSNLPFRAGGRGRVLPAALGAGVDHRRDLPSGASRPELDCDDRIVLDLLLAHGVLHGRQYHDRIRDSRESSGQVQVYAAVGPAQTAACPRSQPNTTFHLGHGVDCKHSVLQLVAVVGRRALVPDAHSLGRCNRHPGAGLAILLLGVFPAWSGEHSGFCSQCLPS